MADKDTPLLVSLERGILRLTLNRPREHNALDPDLIGRLETVLRESAADDGVRVVILSGGRRAFCFGADLKDLPRDPEKRGIALDAILPRFQTMIVRLAHYPAPTIAAIGGFATGAGLDLALACDLRLAASTAKLSSAFVRMGLVPDGGSTYRLPRLVGLGRAFELLYASQPLTAEKAHAMGLVNRVVPAADLQATADELARTIAELPPAAVRAAKSLLLSNLGEDLEGALAGEAIEQSTRFRAREFTEALGRIER
jgi:2-(1,2-epoxy-1,2-dihydrophenyl)acetyl-CoA isomerase